MKQERKTQDLYSLYFRGKVAKAMFYRVSIPGRISGHLFLSLLHGRFATKYSLSSVTGDFFCSC